ncbi:hypothetical protein cand_015530 [Cryptosporidium andersoni]|uniref:Magnesium transporter n=1 Tax=Cryptosporidium andersoni TaxID=117008 RepID=A0A1J4MU03_9CRYT|nr:hypothetical protein cand_015530 [Cryptosporidium andersoni]
MPTLDSSSSTTLRWPIGVSIALIGSLLGALGDNFVRKSFLSTQKRYKIAEISDISATSKEDINGCSLHSSPDNSAHLKSKSPKFWEMVKNPMWLIGIILAAGADTIATLAALVFAPATLITPFAGMHIFWSMLIACLWLKERIGFIEWIGAICIVGGIICVVVFAGKIDGFTTVYQFAPLLKRPAAICYIVINLTLLIIFPLLTMNSVAVLFAKCIYKVKVYMKKVSFDFCNFKRKLVEYFKKKKDKHKKDLKNINIEINLSPISTVATSHQKQSKLIDNISSMDLNPSSPIESDGFSEVSSPTICSEFIKSSESVATDFVDIKDMRRIIIILEAFGVSASSGIFGANTNLSAKVFTLYISQLFSGKFSFFSTWEFYVVTIVTLTCAIFQLYFLNKALSKFEAIYVVPITNSILIATSEVGGICAFNEIPESDVGFSLGVVIIIIGVLLLSIFKAKRTSIETPKIRSFETNRLNVIEEGNPHLSFVKDEVILQHVEGGNK